MTSSDNGSSDDVNKVIRQQIKQFDRNDIPSFSGAGQRGQGNTAAAEFLAASAAVNPGEFTLLITGPLTNAFSVAKCDPHIFSTLHQIICMGGYSIHCALDSPTCLNSSSDLEAAYAVVNAKTKVTIFNAHICLKAPFSAFE